MVNSLDVIEFVLGTKYFITLYHGIAIAERMGLKGGYLSTDFMYFTKTIKTLALEPTALIFLCCSTLRDPHGFKDFKYLLIRFLWFTVKI